MNARLMEYLRVFSASEPIVVPEVDVDVVFVLSVVFVIHIYLFVAFSFDAT